MIQANLIPIPRRLARQQHKRVRLWLAVCCIYSVLLLGGFGVLQAMSGRDGQVLEHDAVTITQEITNTDKEVKHVAPKLHNARLTLAASLAVGSQPDWSVLLALLSKEMREDDAAMRSLLRCSWDITTNSLKSPANLSNLLMPVYEDHSKQIVLSSCELSPVAAPVAAPGAAANLNGAAASPRYSLSLTGVGRTQAAISQYVLRLEQAGIFDRVTLIESKLGPFAGGEAVSFRIGCTLGDDNK